MSRTHLFGAQAKTFLQTRHHDLEEKEQRTFVDRPHWQDRVDIVALISRHRLGRDHESFITNVKMDPDRFTRDLAANFNADGRADAESLRGRIRRLREQRYDVHSWHFRH